MIRLSSLVVFAFLSLAYSEVRADEILAIPKVQTLVTGKSLSRPQAALVEKPFALDGFSSPQIVGGTTAARSDFPEFVQLWG